MGTSAGYRALDSAGEPDEDGWVETELWVESEEVALGQLASVGGDVEVLAPVSLRSALHRVGLALTGYNAGDGAPTAGSADASGQRRTT